MTARVLIISDLSKLKFTSLKNVIHFKYDEVDYTLYSSDEDETFTCLCQGRCKGQIKGVSRCYGHIREPIIYKNNKRVLSAIDKENFVKSLYCDNLIDLSDELKELKEEVDKSKAEYEEIGWTILELDAKRKALKWH